MKSKKSYKEGKGGSKSRGKREWLSPSKGGTESLLVQKKKPGSMGRKKPEKGGEGSYHPYES